MSFFTTDYKDVQSFDPVPPGEYECIISEVKPQKFSTGAEGLSVQLTIRSDVDQPMGKRKLFDNLVTSEKAMFRFQQVAKAARLPEGQNYPTRAAFAKAILHKAVRVRVKHEEYQGKTQERVNFYMEPQEEYTGDPINGGPAGNPFEAAPPSEVDAPPTTEGIKPPWEQ